MDKMSILHDLEESIGNMEAAAARLKVHAEQLRIELLGSNPYHACIIKVYWKVGLSDDDIDCSIFSCLLTLKEQDEVAYMYEGRSPKAAKSLELPFDRETYIKRPVAVVMRDGKLVSETGCHGEVIGKDALVKKLRKLGIRPRN